MQIQNNLPNSKACFSAFFLSSWVLELSTAQSLYDSGNGIALMKIQNPDFASSSRYRLREIIHIFFASVSSCIEWNYDLILVFIFIKVLYARSLKNHTVLLGLSG